MGLNVNLARMVKAPLEAECPACRRAVRTRAESYDIECGNPNPAEGVWRLHCYCPHCEHDWELLGSVNVDWCAVSLTP